VLTTQGRVESSEPHALPTQVMARDPSCGRHDDDIVVVGSVVYTIVRGARRCGDADPGDDIAGDGVVDVALVNRGRAVLKMVLRHHIGACWFAQQFVGVATPPLDVIARLRLARADVGAVKVT
jgi:hypothetical protein